MIPQLTAKGEVLPLFKFKIVSINIYIKSHKANKADEDGTNYSIWS